MRNRDLGSARHRLQLRLGRGARLAGELRQCLEGIDRDARVVFAHRLARLSEAQQRERLEQLFGFAIEGTDELAHLAELLGAARAVMEGRSQGDDWLRELLNGLGEGSD